MTLELLLMIIASAASIYGAYYGTYLYILVARHKKELRRRASVVSGSGVTSQVHHQDGGTNSVKA